MKENPYAGIGPARPPAAARAGQSAGGGLGPVSSDPAAYWNQRSAQPAPPEKPHIYCTTCGAKLQLQMRHVGYDGATGKPITESWLQCPRRRWWHRWSNHRKREC